MKKKTPPSPTSNLPNFLPYQQYILIHCGLAFNAFVVDATTALPVILHYIELRFIRSAVYYMQ